MYGIEEVILTGLVLVQSRGLLLVTAAQLDVPVSLELNSPTPAFIHNDIVIIQFSLLGIFQRICFIIKLHVCCQARLHYRPQPRVYCSGCFQHLWRLLQQSPNGQFPRSQPCAGGQRGKESTHSPCLLRLPSFCSPLDWTLL